MLRCVTIIRSLPKKKHNSTSKIINFLVIPQFNPIIFKTATTIIRTIITTPNNNRKKLLIFCATFQRRFFSSSSTKYNTNNNTNNNKNNNEKKVVTPRSVLKKFYRLVHPDLFTAYPNAKEVNEKSFQQLSAFLNEFEDNALISKEQKQYQLTFYYRSTRKNNTEEEFGEEDLEKFSITLQSPPQHISSREDYLGDCLKKMFSLCGIIENYSPTSYSSSPFSSSFYSPFYDDSGGSGGSFDNIFTRGPNYDQQRDASPDNPSLYGFLNNNIGDVYDIMVKIQMMERKVEMAQTILYIQEKIKVFWNLPDYVGTPKSNNNGSNDSKDSNNNNSNYNESNSSNGDDESDNNNNIHVRNSFELWQAKYFLLEKFTAALTMYKDEFPDADNLKSATILFCEKYYQDPLNRIVLGIHDPELSWKSQLSHYNPNVTVSVKEAGNSRNILERKVAENLGLSYFYTDFETGNSTEYLNFLNSMNNSGIRRMEGVTNVKICVIGNAHLKQKQQQQQQQQQQGEEQQPLDAWESRGFSSNYRTCTITVPISSTPIIIQEYLLHTAPIIESQYERHYKESLEIAEHVIKVKQVFRLKTLNTDKTLENWKILDCAKNLLRNTFVLKNVLLGTSIYITNVTKVDNVDGTIYVRWDFAV